MSDENRVTDRGEETCDLDDDFPVDALQRFTSNPLERCDSNVSCTSQDGGATFVPFGRGVDVCHSEFIDFTSLNKMIRQLGTSTHSPPPPIAPPEATSPLLTSPIPILTGRPVQPSSDTTVYNRNVPPLDGETIGRFPVNTTTNTTGYTSPTPTTPIPITPPPSTLTPVTRLIPTPISLAAPALGTRSNLSVSPVPSHHSHHSHHSNRTPLTGCSAVSSSDSKYNQSVFTPNSPASRKYRIKSTHSLTPASKSKKSKQKTSSKHGHKSNATMVELLKKDYSLSELLERDLLCRFFKDQNGSRYVQDRLTQKRADDIIDEVLKHIIFGKYEILTLAQDIYGNYVIQMLFEIGNKFHHKLLINHLLKSNVYRLTHSFYGCRVIQTAFDFVPIVESIRLIRELANKSISECILGQNAHHVIQKVLALGLDSKHVKFIIECVHQDIYYFSAHIFGCRVVQSMINHHSQHIVHRIIQDEALILKLSKSEYGNYVMQDLLALEHCQGVQSVVTLTVFRNVASLSKNKFGSNVVEKCLLSATDEERGVLLEQLMNKTAILVEMVHDRYGNYVVQRLLTNCNHKQQSKLIYLIEKYIPNLAQLKYGKHIMDKVKKIKSKYKTTLRY